MDERSEPRGDRGTALSLMRMALALLDRTDELAAAARLQHAIDTLEGRKPGQTDPSVVDRILGES